jgi:2-dehydro-3-deoxyglucarate aldolase/4-hydroxy-2-oxoheptanedioate aldolase
MTMKEKLQAGNILMGFEISYADPSISEMASRLDFDFLWLDMEHASVNHETMLSAIIACSSGSAASVVRVPWNEPYETKRILEMGPDGIIFPMVNSAAEAKTAMDSCMYPPYGRRGFGPRRACNYLLEDLSVYIKEVSDRFCRFIQIEHIDAVRELDEILKVSFLDGIIVGPCDLSDSIGLLNDIYNPKVIKVIDDIVQKCKTAGIPAGIAVGVDTPELLKFWLDKGFQFISAGSDMGELGAAIKRKKLMIDKIRNEYI